MQNIYSLQILHYIYSVILKQQKKQKQQPRAHRKKKTR